MSWQGDLSSAADSTIDCNLVYTSYTLHRDPVSMPDGLWLKFWDN
jgi:hypothetical protein